MCDHDYTDRFAMTFDREHFRRLIGGSEVIIHCHHYNSRIQHTIESSATIDGRAIFVDSAEQVFARQLGGVLRASDSVEQRYSVAAALYAHLGYGELDLSTIEDDVVEAKESHFAEGWMTSFPTRRDPVCSLTCGFIQAAVFACSGATVNVREVACIAGGAEACRFEIDRSRERPVIPLELARVLPKKRDVEREVVRSANVDEEAIIRALVDMPIHGNAAGLIPAFNVYLANTPADFYNLVCIRYIEQMTAAGLGDSAKAQLVYDAETCGMNTFKGIMASTEWDALIAPMVKEPGDALFGLIAVSNALGWGKWQVTEHTVGESLALASWNGYEASGQLEIAGESDSPSCHMLTGVSAGIMELLYGTGALRERFGQFEVSETKCRAHEGECCRFRTRIAE